MLSDGNGGKNIILIFFLFVRCLMNLYSDCLLWIYIYLFLYLFISSSLYYIAQKRAVYDKYGEEGLKSGAGSCKFSLFFF